MSGHRYFPYVSRCRLYLFTLDGVGEVTDFMPIEPSTERTKRHRIIRAVHVVRGSMTFELIRRPAFNYARATHTLALSERGAVFRSADESLGLFSSTPLAEDGQGGVHATFTLQQDQWAHVLLESTGDPERERSTYCKRRSHQRDESNRSFSPN